MNIQPKIEVNGGPYLDLRIESNPQSMTGDDHILLFFLREAEKYGLTIECMNTSAFRIDINKKSQESQKQLLNG